MRYKLCGNQNAECIPKRYTRSGSGVCILHIYATVYNVNSDGCNKQEIVEKNDIKLSRLNFEKNDLNRRRFAIRRELNLHAYQT